VDLRAGKNLRFGRTRTLVAIDVYNLFNANPGLTYQQGFAPATATQAAGASWYNPSTLLMPRFVRFNVTFDF
jgi:hypothetical protein